ncbi:MAG: hypothetical protein JWR69_3995 [Pedosphaera sp.]|nr:hypothetical protein [Pedosphaera sp.]
MDKELSKRILNLKEKIVSHFTSSDWTEVGLLTGHVDIINSHSRLLRSLSFGDSDYSGNVLDVLMMIAKLNPSALSEFDSYLDRKYPDESHFISAKPSVKKLTFAPHVFSIPEVVTEEAGLVAVMMPFHPGFNRVYEAIKSACADVLLHSQRADDIWEDSVIIQDIFNLILRAKIVIVDFTGKNPNVMYETGIAHTLGKLVIPISQSLDDVPFDIKHHRVLKYLPNQEGCDALRKALAAKIG